MKELEPPITASPSRYWIDTCSDEYGGQMRTSLNPTGVIYPSDPVFSTKGMPSVYANLTSLRIPMTQTGTASDASRLLGLLDALLSSLPVLDTLHMLIGNLGAIYNADVNFPDTWMRRMLLSRHDRPTYWSNRVRTLVLDQVEGSPVRTFSTQLLVVILARMSSLRVLEVRLPALGALRVLSMSRDVAASYANVIPDWPLERLVMGVMPSGVMCALLRGARTSSLRTLDLYAAKNDPDVIASVLQLTQLETIIFREDLQLEALKGWLPVIIMPTVERLRICREQFILMAFFLPWAVRCDQSLFVPSNVVHLELECKNIMGSVDGETHRAIIEEWVDLFASVLDDQSSRRDRTMRLRSITLFVRYNEHTGRSRAENVDFGPLMNACAARRIRLNCVNFDTGIAMGIQRCARSV